MVKWSDIAILAILVSLAGCTRMEVAMPEREVTFSVGSQTPATKAVAVTEFDHFSSKGYLHAEGVNTVQDFFGTSGETISYNSTTTEWQPSHPYYWPKSENSYINFVSWYDKNGAPDTVTENTIAWTNRTITADDNILVAKKAWNQKANVFNYFTPGVPTIFRHLLGKVVFEVKASIVTETNGPVTTTWSIDIENFTLKEVYKTGTLSLTSSEEPAVQEGEPCVSAWTGSWETVGATGTIPGDDVTVNTTTPVSVLSTSVLPQSLEDKAISFDYTITTTSSNGTETHVLEETMNSGDLELSSFSGNSGNWDINKIITYTITITTKTGAITLHPTVADLDSSLTLNVE